jgi:ParB/RepB/Spo0J family partition protein
MPEDKIEYILSDLIDLPERQMRRDINREALYELAENIKANGLISPITVRPTGDRYELVAGQRRLLACGIARIIRIPCIVRTLDDISALSIMAAENLERKDVDLIDEANFIKLVMDTEHLSLSQMAERMKRGTQYVKDRLLVAEMPDYMQSLLKADLLKIGVALHLVEIEPDDKRRIWVGLAVEQKIPIHEAAWWVQQHRLGLLPSVVNSATDIPNAPDAPHSEPMFTCAVDGKQYPANDCQAVFVFKGNFEYLSALRSELSAPTSETQSPAGG